MIEEQQHRKSMAEADQTIIPDDEYWMNLALLQAKKASVSGEVPVGAILVKEETLIAAGFNTPVHNQDPTAHAEIVVIRKAAKEMQNYRLPKTTLYVTLEPCIMCMGAMIHARVQRLVYGAADPKTGAASSVYGIGNDGRLNHNIEICGGVMADRCGGLLKAFFQDRRKL